MRWFIAVMAMIVLSWASLFTTILVLDGRLNKLATQNQQLALTAKQLADQNKKLSDEIKTETDSIHKQATCIFLFFRQPQATRNNTSVTYPPACVTTNPSSAPVGSANGSNKSV